MDSFMISANAVLPFLIYIAFGYGVRHSGLVDEAFMFKLNRMIFQAFFPILMFNNFYNLQPGFELNPVLVVTAVLSILTVQALSILIVPRLVPEDTKRGVLIQAIYRSNYVLFGIPLAQNLFHDDGVILATAMIAIIIPIYNVTAVIILEMYRGGKVSPSTLLKNVCKNPMLRGAAVGLAFNILGIRLPGSVMEPISQFASLTTPLALFVLGGTLHFSAIQHNLKYVVPSMSVKLLVLPAIAVALSVVLGFTPVERFVYFEMFATPVATASYSMAQNMGGDGELAGQLVVLSTAASVLTIFLWVFLFTSIGFV